MGKDEYEFLRDYWKQAKPGQSGEFHDVDESLCSEIKLMTSVSGHYESIETATKELSKQVVETLSPFLCDEQKAVANSGVTQGKYEIPFIQILCENLLKFHDESIKEQIQEKNLTDDEMDLYDEMKKRHSKRCKSAIARFKSGPISRKKTK
ncbi:hypothetical protein WR25_09555 [Diploscapter pachys]|uniref:Uncharacterized protein n=1 Tax=Diploscapter pachys TaxID=2018661 RepID=A0A2A2KX41_9BILA|nr:hypothetical protein WR25_09555 [Diploscapter pachys]